MDIYDKTIIIEYYRIKNEHMIHAASNFETCVYTHILSCPA